MFFVFFWCLFSSEIYVEDCLFYDSLTVDKQRYTTIEGSPVLTYSSNGLNVNTSVTQVGLVRNNFLTLPSNYEAELTITLQTASAGGGICFDDWLLDSGGSTYCSTYKLSNTTRLSQNIAKFKANDIVKIVKNGTSISYYLNGTLIVTNTISDDTHYQHFRSYNGRTGTYKNLKVKPL